MVIGNYITDTGDAYDFGLSFPGASGYPAKLAEQEKWLRTMLNMEDEWHPPFIPADWEHKRDEVLEVLQQELTGLVTKQAAFQQREPVEQPQKEFHNSGLDKTGVPFVCNCNQHRKFLLRVGSASKLPTFKEQVMSQSPIGSSFCFRLKLAREKFSHLWVGQECIVEPQ